MTDFTLLGAAASAAKTQTRSVFAEKEENEQDEFLRLMEKFDSLQETEQERNARRAREAREAQAKRDRTRKANELQARIAFLRSRLMANRGDTATAAELSMATTQLYWLTNSV